MNGQKIGIKYFALALGIVLAIAIISAIAGGALSVLTVVGLLDRERPANDQSMSFAFNNVTAVQIENDIGKLEILPGDSCRVEAQNVTENFTCEVQGETLVVKNELGGGAWGFAFGGGAYSDLRVTVYLPRDRFYRQVTVHSGAGELYIEELEAGEINLEIGAGRAVLKGLSAEKGKIEGGAGELTIERAELSDITLQSGVGALSFSGALLGDSRVSCGIGAVNLDLTARIDDYDLTLSAGIAEIVVNGERVKSGHRGNITAGNTLKVEGGIGRVVIDFLGGGDF